MWKFIRWMLGLCNHEDSPQDSATVRSPAERFREQVSAAAEPGQAVKMETVGDSIPKWYYQTTFISIIRCNKCGRTKHSKTLAP